MMDAKEALRLKDALARGQRAAEQLGAATDELTETLAQIERALAEQQLGVSASVHLETESIYDQEEREYSSVSMLAFRKEGKRWMLMIDSGIDPAGPDDLHSIPLINASRALRMQAIDKLPSLVEALVGASVERLTEITAAHTKARALLETLTVTRKAKEKAP